MRSSIILCFFIFYTIQVYAQMYTTVTIKTPNQTAFQAYSYIMKIDNGRSVTNKQLIIKH